MVSLEQCVYPMQDLTVGEIDIPGVTHIIRELQLNVLHLYFIFVYSFRLCNQV